MKILIIEDDRVGAHVFSTYLRKGGFEVKVATDGPAGVAQVKEWQPDGVLLDIMLPGMSGIEVLKVIRSEKKDLPVVVYTNGYIAQMVNDARAAGATHVINKLSLNANELVHKFKQALSGAKEPANSDLPEVKS